MSVAAYTPDVGDVFPFPARRGVTLSHRVRFAQFAANVDPAGTALRVANVDTLVAGAMPYWLEGLYRGRAIDLWVPLVDADPPTDRSQFWLIGRLNPGVSPAQAQAAIDDITWPGGDAIAVIAYTGQTPEAAGGMRRVGSLLQLAAAAVFLIACANVAAFLLTRASARARETAVRVAIGARRRQLIRQLLIDSALISVMGGAAGLDPRLVDGRHRAVDVFRSGRGAAGLCAGRVRHRGDVAAVHHHHHRLRPAAAGRDPRRPSIDDPAA